MRILVVHNHYGNYAVGGEAQVMESEAGLLKEHGHVVMKYERTNAEIGEGGFPGKLKAAWNSAWSRASYDAMGKIIREFRPDVMHVHNYWLLLTPSVFAAAKDCDVPTVLTLHNYRLICPGGQFLRNGRPCELCLDGVPLRALLYRCYPGGSLLKSFLSLRLYQETRKRKFLADWVDAYIALSAFGRKKFVEGGLPEEKVHVKPNFMVDPCNGAGVRTGMGAIFIGRISPEKGVDTLLRAWKGVDYPLTVVGDGPFAEQAKQMADAKVTFTGEVSHEAALQLSRESSIFIFPSHWYEGFGLSLLEAMATGRAIIASDLGVRREMIQDGVTGLLFQPGNAEDLRRKVVRLVEDPDLCKSLGNAARRFYLENYTPERNYVMLMDIYRSALNGGGRSRASGRYGGPEACAGAQTGHRVRGREQ